ncbi:hypothetical protein [Salinisphaera sp.]|uniref:hypothetical protein n=1 Tax=Salinisphaera sp. TaxID=1914330 RepID=UPI002D7819D2|nr:hypothetical protein [Salinisphaera sp.]HET7314478.1 hypothetical protein [Salinisphaera sp.]
MRQRRLAATTAAFFGLIWVLCGALTTPVIAAPAADGGNAFGLSAKDQRQLEQLRQMERSGKLEECLQISFSMMEVMYPFSMAAAASHYDIPGTQPKPGTLTEGGKLLEDLSANIADEVPSDALYKLGRQVALQEGKRPLEITPEMQAQMDRIAAWLDAHCHPQNNKKGETEPSIGSAKAAQPVPNVSTDAPGVAFGKLSANDAAIVKAAQGIQLGDPGAANIQIIFDPNAPYGAKLYRYLRQAHPDLAIRWVPIAYFGKTSKAVTAILLNSRHPKRDLHTDLRYYNFDRHEGGVQPGRGHSYSLPPEQKRLRKAWEKWGGYTPMIVFCDQSGRWLRAGGSGKGVIDSVLARARASAANAHDTP